MCSRGRKAPRLSGIVLGIRTKRHQQLQTCWPPVGCSCGKDGSPRVVQKQIRRKNGGGCWNMWRRVIERDTLGLEKREKLACDGDGVSLPLPSVAPNTAQGKCKTRV